MIGLFGGTFDPIHFGHLRPIREASEHLQFDFVVFIPTGQPPHRPPPHASAVQRRDMTVLAIEGDARFRLDECELERAGPSYTVDTLRALRAEHGRTPLCLILGHDAFTQLDTWKESEALPALAHVVVLARPGVGHALPAWARTRVTDDPRALRATSAGRVWLEAVTPQPISATDVRARLARGEDVSALVPAPVLDYIRRHHLYTNEEANAKTRQATTRC